MESEIRVSERFKCAQEDALDAFADPLVDQLLGDLAALNPFDENKVSQLLAADGLRPEDVNALSDGKTAAPMVKALGGFVLRGLWYAMIRPFLVLRKLITSEQFRREIKASCRRALRKEGRDTRHMLDVANRWARGDYVHPNEFKAARQQVVRLIAQVVLVYFAAPEVAGLFTGGVWQALGRLVLPAEKVLLLLLERPLRAVMGKLLTTPTT